ncbi:pol polyprotein [Striga asiatica]|uniref:Pol polyprotein n=1 Tax=Striga asiatica TaxID=4170 RepID=A0A5A7RK56_STRAF|nr:pol polyprotein [Striga asiatica]
MTLLHLPPQHHHMGQYSGQILSGLHGPVKECARNINGQRVVPLLELIVTPLEILSTNHFFLSEYGKQRHIERGPNGYGLDFRDYGFDGLGHEGPKDELSELGVVITLVKENGLSAQDSLFADWECGLEDVGLGD